MEVADSSPINYPHSMEIKLVVRNASDQYLSVTSHFPFNQIRLRIVSRNGKRDVKPLLYSDRAPHFSLHFFVHITVTPTPITCPQMAENWSIWSRSLFFSLEGGGGMVTEVSATSRRFTLLNFKWRVVFFHLWFLTPVIVRSIRVIGSVPRQSYPALHYRCVVAAPVARQI